MSNAPGVRNPVEAVRLSEDVCRQTENRDPAALRILARAHSAAGSRKRAMDTANQAIKQANSLGLRELAGAIRAEFKTENSKKGAEAGLPATP